MHTSFRPYSGGVATLDHRLKRWPEGYAYTSFCLSVASAILRDEFSPIPLFARGN